MKKQRSQVTLYVAGRIYPVRTNCNGPAQKLKTIHCYTNNLLRLFNSTIVCSDSLKSLKDWSQTRYFTSHLVSLFSQS